MRSAQSGVAQICLLLLLAPNIQAQQQTGVPPQITNTPPGQPPPAGIAGSFNWLTSPNRITRNYVDRGIPEVGLSNSPRLEQLIRAGKLYLSLADAVALALENNIDIAVQRYGFELVQADLLRAQAGGQIRGASTAVTGGPQSAAVNLVTGAASGSTGTTGRASNESASGTVFQVTGTAIPTYDTVFNVGFNKAHTSSPQSNSFTTGLNALVIDNYAWQAGVSKNYDWGGSLGVNYTLRNIRSNSPNNDLNPFFTGNANIQFQQRLLQGFGRAVNNRNIRISRNNLKVTDLTFKNQVISTVSSIVNLYFDLVSLNADVKVKEQAVALAQKLFEDNKKQVEIGTLAPIEIVRAEAQVAQTQQDLTVSETQLLQQETIIKNALSRNGLASPSLADARIIPTDPIRVPDSEILPPVPELVQTALENRPEIEQTRLQIANTKIGLAGSKSALLPGLDLFASLQNNALSGDINTLLPSNRPPIARIVDPFFIGGFPEFSGQIFRRNFPDYNVGFQLNIPVGNRQARADIANDTLRLRQQELQEQRQLNSVRVDVQQAVIAVQQARARYQAAVKARQLQEQTLDAEQKKYALGSSTIFIVVQTQRDLAQAQGNEVAATANYSRAKTQLDVATGTVLTTNNIELAEAVAGKVNRAPTALPTP